MESIREDRRRRDAARIAWMATILAALDAMPRPHVRHVVLAVACIGWFLLLVDQHLTALERGEGVDYRAGRSLLGICAATALINTNLGILPDAGAACLLLWSLWTGWADLLRVRSDRAGPRASP